MVNMHLMLAVPMPKKVSAPLSLCVELLKVVEGTAKRKSLVVSESIPHIIRILSLRLLKVVAPVRAKVEESPQRNDHTMDVLAAIKVLERVLLGSESLSFAGLNILALSLSLCLNPTVAKKSERDGAIALFRRIELLASLNFDEPCSCCFLLWFKELLPTFISHIYNTPTEAHRLQFICAAFCDGARVLRHVQDETGDNRHLTNFKKFVTEAIEDGVVMPVCFGVEKDLRLRIHAKTQNPNEPDQFNPKLVPPKALKPFLDLEPLRVLGTELNIRQRVTSYLEDAFYNLTTVCT